MFHELRGMRYWYSKSSVTSRSTSYIIWELIMPSTDFHDCKLTNDKERVLDDAFVWHDVFLLLWMIRHAALDASLNSHAHRKIIIGTTAK